jgi:hypothetical protein
MSANVTFDENRAIVARALSILDGALASWYGGKMPEEVEPGEGLESIILAQHFANVSVWDLEDQARRTDVEDAYIASIKRRIDGRNQRRNNLMESIDETLLATLGSVDLSNAVQHSEAAGIMVDRLSILTLKIHHMSINAARKDDPELACECAGKVDVLRVQRADLLGCVESLLDEFAQGKRFFKVYRQFKAYNDARLNPALYQKKG